MRSLARFILLGTLVVAGCGGSPGSSLSGMVREPQPKVDVASLPDESRQGRPMPFRADPDGLLLVYFGYTMCPDVCPTTMSDIKRALQDLPVEDSDRVRVALVTVDPDRDSPAILRNYVRAFARDGHALRTTDAALLKRVAQVFGASYGVERRKDGEVEVSHTAITYAVDDRGRIVLQWAFGTPWDDLRNDIDTLLEREAESE